ncbi:P1 family peptidase [Calothrix sp. NIES-2098]|uniref:P1 family peptidase n=1 Tax=Calothrix sp. NIES-2098 TaxID=1954171 RepID=UPI000B5EA616|nr:peptidase family T4 [Calothrix sp. NIES-2098]
MKLTPKTEFDEPLLKFDFPSIHIGVAEYELGKTGCTVFYFPHGAIASVDIRGGAPGTIMAGDGWVDAICYAGGSLYGLEAATGVSAELFALRNYSTHWYDIAVVRGAIIFDFLPRDNSIYPDKELGKAALKAAKPDIFPLGARGAGRSATVGKVFDFSNAESAGQGGAFRQIGETKLAVFTIVNAIGAIVDRQGQVVRGLLNPNTGERCCTSDDLEQRIKFHLDARTAKGNTTLTLVATNQKLQSKQLKQLAKQVHGSMARAIQPFHTLDDGDVLYAVTTNEVENKYLETTALGILASELAWDAVLSCFANASSSN